MQRSFSHNLAPVDPRLDWTVGRRGVIFLDWNPIPCHDWIRNQNHLGSYVGKNWLGMKLNWVIYKQRRVIRTLAKNGSVQDASTTYVVNPYQTGSFTAKGANFARNAIRMETV